jgi:hypothetical protein
MVDKRITELDAATAFGAADLFPIVQGGATKKITAAIAAPALLFQKQRYLRPSGDTSGEEDAAVLQAAATDLGGPGRIFMDGGTWYINDTLPMLQKQFWEGVGTESTIIRPVGTITMFGYTHTGSQEVAWGMDQMTLYGYSNASVAMNTKMSTMALWDVKLGRVYFDGFGAGLGENANPVVIIGDPWGFRALETIIEQTGPRPAITLTGNGDSKRDAKLIACKIANNGGHNLRLVNCNGAVVEATTMYSVGDGAQNITLDGSGLCSLMNNDIIGGGDDQFGYVLTGGSLGNTIQGGGVDGQNAEGFTGVGIVSGSDHNLVQTVLFQCATQVANAGANNVIDVRP